MHHSTHSKHGVVFPFPNLLIERGSEAIGKPNSL